MSTLSKPLSLFIRILSGITVSYSQKVTVSATTNKKEVEAILRKEREASRINQAFFAEDKKCRAFLRAREWIVAETSCRAAIVLVEQLPKEHILERSSIRLSLASSLLWQRRPEEAISLLNTAIEISKSILDDSDAEKGDIYLTMGHAHRLLVDVPAARSYYERAEATYRSAFVKIGEDDIRFAYGRYIKNVVEAHYALVKSEGLVAESEKLLARLAQVEKDFAKYLVK
jgi:tetratricopeptide (TPR) repeat protein